MQAANVAAVNLVKCVFICALDGEVAGLFNRKYWVRSGNSPFHDAAEGNCVVARRGGSRRERGNAPFLPLSACGWKLQLPMRRGHPVVDGELLGDGGLVLGELRWC